MMSYTAEELANAGLTPEQAEAGNQMCQDCKKIFTELLDHFMPVIPPSKQYYKSAARIAALEYEIATGYKGIHVIMSEYLLDLLTELPSFKQLSDGDA